MLIGKLHIAQLRHVSCTSPGHCNLRSYCSEETMKVPKDDNVDGVTQAAKGWPRQHWPVI